jgi:hypothetical protein
VRRQLIKRYLKIVFAGGLIASLAVFVGATINGNLAHNFWIFRCSPSGYGPSYYLSYCGDRAYGNYEHIAFFGGLEPDAIAHLKKADALFLGNSKARRAFSADAVYRYFDAYDAAPYNLGFGYGEYDLFPLALIEKYGLTPKVLIINTDYFFYNGMSTAAKSAVRDINAGVGFFVSLKRRVQQLHQDWCGRADQPYFAEYICEPHAVTLFRSRIDGRTMYQNIDETQVHPATISESGPDPDAAVYIANARNFLARISTPRSCVFLTVTPSINTDRRVAKLLSEALGLPYIETEVTLYITYDGNHLRAESAERWTTDVLQKADAGISGCLAAS